MTSPASPQPGNQDERCPVHPGCRHGGWDLGGSPPIVRESIEDALENDRCGICLSVDHFREDCPRAAAAAGETDDLDRYIEKSMSDPEFRDAFKAAQKRPAADQPGEEADERHTSPLCPRGARHALANSGRNVTAGALDCWCPTEPAPSAGQDTGQLRDEIEETLRQHNMWWAGDRPGVVDALLDGPLRQLIAERDEAVAKVQRVEVAVDNARHMGWVSTEALCRALGSS